MDKRDQNDLENPLGIAGTPVERDPNAPHPDQDEAAVRRRRARAGLGPDADDRTTDGLGDLNTDADGAAGIDMGYGGEGSGIKERGKR